METTKCHFCGYQFTEDELLSKCAQCPMKSSHQAAKVSCCPNCGIEVRMKSSLVEFIQKVASKVKPAR